MHFTFGACNSRTGDDAKQLAQRYPGSRHEEFVGILSPPRSLASQQCL